MLPQKLLRRRLALLALPLCAVVAAACSSSSGSGAPPGGASPRPTIAPTLPAAGTVSATISGLGVLPPGHGYKIVASDTAVWVLNGDSGNLLRIDPGTNTIVATIPVGFGLGDIAFAPGAVWVVAPSDGKIVRVDVQTNRVVATIREMPQENIQAIAASPDAVWVSDFAEDTLLRINPHTNTVAARLPHTLGITGVSYGTGSVWI